MPSMLRRAEDVDLYRLHGVVLVMDGARGTGEIEDPVDFEEDRLRDVVSHEFEGGAAEEMGDVLLPAREEIVETDYLVAVADESLAKVGTDEPGASGDENTLRLRIGMVGVHEHLPARRKR